VVRGKGKSQAIVDVSGVRGAAAKVGAMRLDSLKRALQIDENGGGEWEMGW
jgi:hypothetical protein